MYPYTMVSCCRSMCCIIQYNAVCQLGIMLVCMQEEVMCFLSINSHPVKYYIFLLLKPWQWEPGVLSDFDELT